RVAGELCVQPVAAALLVVATATGGQGGRVDHRRHVLAAIAQVGRQDLGIPAAAGGDLDDGLVRRQAEEGERLGRVAVRIARRVFRAAPGALQHGGQGRVGVGRGRWRGIGGCGCRAGDVIGRGGRGGVGGAGGDRGGKQGGKQETFHRGSPVGGRSASVAPRASACSHSRKASRPGCEAERDGYTR